VDSRLPSNINYFYNSGSILGLCLILQLISGIILAMFYIPEISLAFESIEYIFRDINQG
jgi:ubiquinol-cytochrome c reductase cytochrome b subunit